jgi:hypothetical protein
MTVGSRDVVINNLERAVSTDINRLQTFKDAALSQLANWLFGVQQLNTELFPGFITQFPPGALDPYQNSVIVNGLMPYPLNGSVDMFVSPGLAFMEDGGYTADQSPFRYVDDPGISAIGTLQLTPAPGATRIDVIECALIENVLEQSNRDIYNPATGLFTPVLVDKVKAGRLQYRIREGAPGGGFPGVVSGWLPLAVVSVPSAAATWDDCTLWDVRPLLSAAHKPPFVNWLQDTSSQTHWSTAEWNAAFTELRVTGKMVNGLGPYNQSGLLGNHPTDVPWIDLANAANWAAGAVPIAGFPYYLWALTPFNLPGWRKYTGISFNPRRPTGMAGVMAVSMVAPTARGFPSLPISPPTATGLGGSTQIGSIAACGVVDSGAIGQPFASDGDWVHQGQDLPTISPVATAPVSGVGTSRYNFVDNILYPASARAIRFTFARAYALGVSPTNGYLYYTVRLVDTITGNDIAVIGYGEKSIHLPLGIGTVQIDIEVPLFFNYALVGTRRIEIDFYTTWSTAAPAVGIELGVVPAWKMTP